jgi:cytochrome c553
VKRSRIPILLWLGCAAAGLVVARANDVPEPLWAYGYATPPAPGTQRGSQVPYPTSRKLKANEPVEEQTRPRRVEGSVATFSRVDIRDGGNVVDWFPGDHPPMPSVLARGPAKLSPTSWGCAYCHLPTGKGRPENAPVAGQPVDYFLRQLEDFRNDARASADPRKPNTPLMTGLAKAMSEGEMREAAEYFGAMKWTAWTRVVETDTVPRTKIEGNLFLPLEQARTEPIAGRIIEVAEDEEQSEVLRNPRSGFLAYVPVGSIKRGESLVTTGAASEGGAVLPGRTLACAACHGPDLMGLAGMPGIAGRSPSYLVRQLYDFQKGTRRGVMSALMQPVVANLTAEDMVAIAAYVTSRVQPPSPAPR